MLFKPDPEDLLKVRRNLALFALFLCITLPFMLVAAHFWLKTTDDLCKAILTYAVAMAAGPVGAYFLAAHVSDKKDGQP